VARNTFLSLFIASARAFTDLERPTNSGATMWGNTTISLSGKSGNIALGDAGLPSLKNFGKAIIVTFYLD
jgi:hypothetical protein